MREIIENQVRQSAIFKPDMIDAIARSILVLPTVDSVLEEGAPAIREENRRLGLGHQLTLGSDFTHAVEDLRGTAAIDFVHQIFAQLQTRHRCTMLRVLGTRSDPGTKRLFVRLHAAETSCMDSLDCDGELYGLAELPVLPLPACNSRQCPCSLELVALNLARQSTRPNFFGRLRNVFRKTG